MPAALTKPLHRSIQSAQRLLAAGAARTAVEGDFATHVPSEIALERCRRTLGAAAAAGLLGVADEGQCVRVLGTTYADGC